MRCLTTVVLVSLLCLGCNRGEEDRRRSVENNLRQLELALKNYHARHTQPTAEPFHVLDRETEYYLTNPASDRPPDGKFPSGTQIRVVKQSGSHVLVRASSGVEGYVSADAVSLPEDLARDVSLLAAGGNRFALEMYRQLSSEKGNLFFSPSSISTALAMAYAGAAGETEVELAESLHLQLPKERVHQVMQALQSFWVLPSEKAGIRLNLANRLWGQASYAFRPEFLEVTRDQYGAELARLNFAQSEESRQAINAWVAQQTADKIPDLIPPGVIAADTKLILTNAVYFHGIWTDPFQKANTKVEDFHVTATEQVQVPLMHRSDEFRYADVDKLQVLEIPYGDKSLSMVVLLPKAVDGLAELESRLTFDNLERWLNSVALEEEVRVYLPKFKTTSQFQLAAPLAALGIKSAFSASAADFSGMTGGRDLFISAVVHKAFVDVNEEGTEAAAATAVVMAPTAAPIQEPKEPPVFRADHPFIFLIRDHRHGGILFLGRIMNPLS